MRILLIQPKKPVRAIGIEGWKEVGLERVFVGLEFFRDEDLKDIRKGSTAEDNIESLRILQAQDIDIYPTFIVKPEFNRDDLKRFINYSGLYPSSSLRIPLC